MQIVLLLTSIAGSLWFCEKWQYKNALVISSGISSSELRAEYYNQPIVKKEELFLRYFLSDGAELLYSGLITQI